jgi:hypothetical protein
MNNKKLNKKETKALVYQKIETALFDIAGALNKKDFGKKLQKASSILAKDIAKAAKKDVPKKAKTKKGKDTKKSAKKLKSKKAGKNTIASPAKMNNVPVLAEQQAASENIAP